MKKSDGYGKNPAEMPYVDEDGIRQLKNLGKMSGSAMKGKDKAMAKLAAIAKAKKKKSSPMVTKIPSSPTR